MVTHIPGIQNTETDLESRVNEVHTEWKLRENIISSICSQLNTNPKIDLFATRLNTQLSTFVSYRPDPKCIAVNALLLDWRKLDFDAFLPFVFLNTVLQKIYQDKAKGIVIAPDWSSQPFYPRLIAMSVKTVSIAPRETKLYLPSQPAIKHPMGKTLEILACLVDGTKIIWNKNRKTNLRLLDIRYKKTVQDILQTMHHILQNSNSRYLKCID